jgi:FecR protein
MQMNTDRSGLARVSLERRRKGSLVLGPRTEVVFNEQIVEGRPPVMTLRQQTGQLRLALVPQGKEPGEGEYWILTKAGKVRVLGTDVYVRTGPWGMVVAVAEGEVEVEGRMGIPVTVREKQWTYVAVGQPPTRPRSDDDGDPPPDYPNERFPFDPPQFDDLRFDLPR